MVLNVESKTFVVYVAALEVLLAGMTIHSFQVVQVGSEQVQVAILKQNKASIEVPAKYLDFLDIILVEKVLVLLKQIEFNEYVIKLEKGKQLPYGLIYSLELVELETLKMYIETYLKTSII